jgi:hypothetical protein
MIEFIANNVWYIITTIMVVWLTLMLVGWMIP